MPELPATIRGNKANLPGRTAEFLRHFAARAGQVSKSFERKPGLAPSHLFGGAIAMRPIVRGFCTVFLIAVCSGVFVGSANASWYWPWGSDDTPKQATPLSSAPPLHQAKPATTANSGGTSILHPSTWSAPKMPWASSEAAATAAKPAPPKSAWAAKSTNTSPSPWQSVKNGTKSAENATASAWHKTIGVFTPAKEEPKQQVAQQQPKSSWWNRVWSSSDEEKPEGPRTVGEFMAQKRLEP
jgi:hypothetical protein